MHTFIFLVVWTTHLGMPAPTQADALVERVGAVSMYVDGLPADLRAPLDALDALTTDEVRALLASDDPVRRGLGVFVADRRCQPELLVEHPGLLNDARASVPVALPDAFNRVHLRESTVAEHARDAWRRWFAARVRTENDARRLREEGRADPWVGLRAWSVACNRADRLPPERREALRRRALALPDDLRWVVATSALSGHATSPLFTEEEARAIVRSVNDETKNAILAGRAPLPADAAEEFGDRRDTSLHALARAILKGEPLPKIPESLPPDLREQFEEGRRAIEDARRRAEEAATPRRDQ